MKVVLYHYGGKFGGYGVDLGNAGGTQDYSGSVTLILSAVVGGCS